MASTSASPAKVGVWTDYSKPGFQAQTLTLTNRDAVVLLAFLATLVGLVGVRSWRITRFLLFIGFLHKSARHDDISHSTTSAIVPQQVILRNSETATGAAFSLLGYAFSKRLPHGATQTRSLKSTVTTGTITLGHGILFIALSILTSQLVVGNTVVSRPTSGCGVWTVRPTTDWDSEMAFSEWQLNKTLNADNYVQNCYFGSTASSAIFDCETLATQSIPFFTQHNATCPFASHVCRGGGQAFAMDTGNISFARLGINTKLADKLSFRRRTVCAPLREELFLDRKYTSANMTSLQGDEEMRVYRFYRGPDNDLPDLPVTADLKSRAYYLVVDSFMLNETEREFLAAPLRLRDQLPDGHHGPSLVMLRGRGIMFNKEYDDPFWSVHTKVEWPNGTDPIYMQKLGITSNDAGLPEAYRMDRDLNLLGCDERLQFCYQATHRCVPWSGLQALPNTTLLEPNADDKTHSELMLGIALVMLLVPERSMQESVGGRDGSSALRASRYVNTGVHFYLEPEQWKTELGYWFATGMARLQLGVYGTVRKPGGMRPEYLVNLWDGAAFELCGRIKFRPGGHTSLNFAGVVAVVAVSVALIILGFFDALIPLMPDRWRGNQLLSEWEMSENLALLERSETGGLELESMNDSGEQGLFRDIQDEPMRQ